MNAPNACSMAERKAFNLASSRVFPEPETVRVTVLSSDAGLEESALVVELDSEVTTTADDELIS